MTNKDYALMKTILIFWSAPAVAMMGFLLGVGVQKTTQQDTLRVNAPQTVQQTAQQTSPATLAPTLTQANFIRAIIGEASNQPFLGQVAIGCAILNRGSLEGVYGVNAPHIDGEPLSTWDMATRATNAALSLYMEGYCHEYGDTCENTTAFNQPNWNHPVIYLQTIGDHNFYWRLKQNKEEYKQ